jgi:hypothetical protein
VAKLLLVKAFLDSFVALGVPLGAASE